MQLIFRISTLLLLASALSSCWMQGPRTVHAPVFKEKGELHVGGFANVVEGLELQTDYAMSNHLFALADVSGFALRSSNSSNWRTGGAVSGGLGLYSTMREKGRFSIYSGFTYGSVGNVPRVSRNSRNAFFLPYIGTNLGFASKHFESILSLRYSGNYFFNRQNSLAKKWAAIEPVGTLRIGGEKLKFHAQLGLSYPLVNTGEPVFISSIGMTYRFKLPRK